MQKFTKFFNARAESHKAQQNKEIANDDEEDDNQGFYDEEEDPKKDDDDDEEINDRELTTDDLTTETPAPVVKGRASFGHVRKEHKADDDIDDFDFKSELTYVEPPRIIDLEEKPMEELSSDYFDNQYFKKEAQHNIDDILKEFESI